MKSKQLCAAIYIVLTGVLCPSSLLAEQLGRLFFTHHDRVYLEQLRLASSETLASKSEKPLAGQQEKEPPENKAVTSTLVTLSGMMTRGNGESVIWLNGASCNGARLPKNVRLRQPASAGEIDYRVPETGKSYQLRPGQTLDVASGQVDEAYKRLSVMAAAKEVEPRQNAESEKSRDTADSAPAQVSTSASTANFSKQ
jgi:hypothetical protein